MTPIELAIETLEFFWRDVSMNDYAFEKLETTLAALRAQPDPPPECQTEGEKTAYAFGWWKGIESVRMAQAGSVNQHLIWALEGVLYWDNGKPDWTDARTVLAEAKGTL